jgi:hypothetical protein
MPRLGHPSSPRAATALGDDVHGQPGALGYREPLPGQDRHDEPLNGLGLASSTHLRAEPGLWADGWHWTKGQ